MKPLPFFILICGLLCTFQALGQVQVFSPEAIQGPYKVVYRRASFDPTAREWKPDSMWVKEDQIINQGSTGPVIQTSRGVSFVYTIGDSSRYTTQFLEGRPECDTLSHSENWRQGSWGNYSAVVKRYHPRHPVDLYYQALKWQNSQWETEVLFKKELSEDADFRITRLKYSQMDRSGSRWIPVYDDSSWYQGQEKHPFRVRSYGFSSGSSPILPILGRVIDSCVYDSLGRKLSSITTQYAFIQGRQDVQYTLWDIYQYYGQDSTVWTQRSISRPPWGGGFRRYGLKHVTKHFTDSTHLDGYDLDTLANTLRHVFRQKQFTLRTANPQVVQKWVRQEWLDSNGGVQSQGGSLIVTQYSSGGAPSRVIRYGLGLQSELNPIEKFDYEYYSPELIADNKPKRKPVPLTVAPNPVKSILNLFSHEMINQVVFVNSLGQSQELMAVGQRVDVGSLPPGLYQVTAFSSGKAVGSARVVKE